MKNKLLFIFVSTYLGMSVSQAEPLNRNIIELTLSQMDSVVAGISTNVWVSGAGSGDFFVYSNSGVLSVSDGGNSAASGGYVAVINFGGEEATDAFATADGEHSYGMDMQMSGNFGEIQAVGVLSIDLPF